MGRLKVYTFKAEKELMHVIDQIAQENKTSRAAFIRQALKALIFDCIVRKMQNGGSPGSSG
jgi:predicted transcriptional regulator